MGLALFIVSFILLYWNEGRVDLSKVAETAIEVSATTEDATAEGQLVSVTGQVKTDETIGDGKYLKPGAYIAVSRKVEMFSWIEHSETKSEKQTGGSETQTTTYSYTKGWTENPENSSSFSVPSGHTNPAKALDSTTVRVNKALVGIYDIGIQNITLPTPKDLALKNEILLLGNTKPQTPKPPKENTGNSNESITTTSTDTPVLGGGYLFSGKGSLNSPQVGDIRISYSTIPNNTDVTVFGKLNEKKIGMYAENKAKLHRLLYGNRDQAIKTLATEHTFTTWMFRLLGFCMMWFGMMMLFGPISVFLDVLPIFGKISRFAIGIGTFIVALALSIATIIVSMIFHSLVALLITVVVVAVILYLWFKKKAKGKLAAQQAQPSVSPTTEVAQTSPSPPVQPQTPQPQAPPAQESPQPQQDVTPQMPTGDSSADTAPKP